MRRSWINPRFRMGLMLYRDNYRAVYLDRGYFIVHNLITHTRRYYSRYQDAMGMMVRRAAE